MPLKSGLEVIRYRPTRYRPIVYGFLFVLHRLRDIGAYWSEKVNSNLPQPYLMPH